VLDRFLKRKDDPTAAVRRAVVHSGLPEPLDVELSMRPMLPGGVDLSPADVIRRATDRGFKPYRHVRMRFRDPIRGPVVVGSMRHYGLGLCAPGDPDAHS
jgi:CRISPR-associated protein Csb2